MKPENLDVTDRKILAELDQDARISYSELGKRIRVAKETVKYRMERLMKEGAIQGFYTAVDFSKLGFVVYRLYLRLRNTFPEIEQEIVKYLAESKNVSVLYRTNGPYHLAMGVWARDIWEYEKFWQDFKHRFGRYVSASHLALMSDYREFSRLYLSGGKAEKKSFPVVTKSGKEKLDQLDFRLLTFLSGNARASIVEIAKKTGASIVTVRSRLKRLMDKKVIVGFRPMLNLNALGREYYKVDLWLSKFDKAEEIAGHILSNPNVIYAEKTLVTSDLEFDVEIENFDKFISLMDSFKAKFPEDVQDYSYYSLVKNYKTSFVPSL
ncbi:MAG: Lrp/AsnC family transcriptional regulator [Candidatus Micrarchaeota archaeon]